MEDTTTDYQSFESVLTAGDATRDIAVMVHKARRGAAQSTSMGDLPSHPLLVPDIGRASDFARPGGFRRQYVASRLTADRQPGDLIDFYSSFAVSILSLTHIGAPAVLDRPIVDGVPSETKTMGVTHTVLAILKSFVGSAVLFLPKGFDNGGLVLSNLLLMLMAAVTVFCVGRLLECAQTLKTRGLQDCTYSKIAFLTMGNHGAMAVNVSLVLSQLGFCCGYLIFIASNVQGAVAVLRGGGQSTAPSAVSVSGTANATAVSTAVANGPIFPAWALIAAQVPIFIGLAWVRRLSYFAVTNLVADGLIVAGLIIIFSCAVYHCLMYPMPALRLFSSRFPLFLGTAAFAFEGIGLVLPIFSSMHPHLQPKLPTLLRDTLAFVVVLFCLFASTVYAAYGEDVRIIVTDNMPAAAAVPVQLAYSCALALSYPLMLFPVITIIEGNLIPMSSHQDPAVKWRKNALRAAIVLSSAVIAYLGYDTLDNFVALIGGFCSVPLAIIYPVIMHTLIARGHIHPDAIRTGDIPASASTDASRGQMTPPPEQSTTYWDFVANIIVGLLGVGVGIFASVFAIWTWPRTGS